MQSPRRSHSIPGSPLSEIVVGFPDCHFLWCVRRKTIDRVNGNLAILA
jgi:hypothetical protein